MNTLTLPEINSDIVIPVSVYNEIKSKQATHLLAMLEGRYKVEKVQPEGKLIALVKKSAIELGQNRLSDQDIDVIAVAISYQQFGEVKIISDDFGVRNMAHHFKILSTSVTVTGGNEKRKYGYSCQACGSVSMQHVTECDTCGHSQLKRFRK